MLQQVAFNQMFLSAKMSDALKAWLENKKKNGGDPVNPPEEITVKINGSHANIILGNGYVLKYTVTPDKYKDKAVWTSSDPSVASVENGVISTHKLGDAVITLTAEGVSDSITVTVVKQNFALDGEGPFQPIVNLSDLENNYSLIIKLDTVNNNIKFFQKGSIKLKTILLTNDFSGISVKPKNPDLAQHFWIGKDKNEEDDAIIYDYYPPDSAFIAVSPEMPKVYETLILSKDGYEDAEIKVILRYDGSHFVYVP
jgi:hypothetical protein